MLCIAALEPLRGSCEVTGGVISVTSRGPGSWHTPTGKIRYEKKLIVFGIFVNSLERKKKFLSKVLLYTS